MTNRVKVLRYFDFLGGHHLFSQLCSFSVFRFPFSVFRPKFVSKQSIRHPYIMYTLGGTDSLSIYFRGGTDNLYILEGERTIAYTLEGGRTT